MRALSFRDRMREETEKAAAAEAADPWRLTLERVRGKVDFFDRLERISSQTLLDLLRSRNATGRPAPVSALLSKVMTEFGWSAVRVRDMTRGGYLEQVRGYCREARGPRPARYSMKKQPANSPIASMSSIATNWARWGLMSTRCLSNWVGYISSYANAQTIFPNRYNSRRRHLKSLAS